MLANAYNKCIRITYVYKNNNILNVIEKHKHMILQTPKYQVDNKCEYIIVI